ncbi:hypothetical protein IFM61392_00855 [Aspergillus lentulus]|uniref:Uncharacterized protein n=1 Tax=Aspergillus lentulus TaxID=293939 RepID=A0ABQ1AMP6_ASPLE|nr:hypothetical protein IFM62136_02657 [Aspergillus lentulus]GFF73264.1 hypothetical protein IFM47457_03349 [Aspergillus lentulus]GFF84557.1 hypothetical protein IFM60648_07068 [Aspergillus lentulus]GFF99486.1 hypothetical protein IFM61392_00855 [Aspergillus lentulus]
MGLYESFSKWIGLRDEQSRPATTWNAQILTIERSASNSPPSSDRVIFEQPITIELYDRLPDLEGIRIGLALPPLAEYSIAFDRLNSFKFHRYREA